MRARGFLAVLAVVAACDSGSSTSKGTGGTPGTGGGTAGGGAGGSGGGAAAAGGSGGSAGATSVGGATGTGGGPAGGSGGTSNGGSAVTTGGTAGGGGSGTGGRTGTGGSSVPTSDAGRDSTRTDGGLAGGGTGGNGGAGGSADTGGARPEAGPEAGVDARPDAPADLSPDARPDTAVSDGKTTSDGAPCPRAGSVTYTLTQNAGASAAEQAAYPLIRAAMDKAVYYYNCYTGIAKKVTVTYNTSVETVDGNINGSIRFGPNTSYMEYTRAMHEISHTVGIGTASNWQSFLVTPDGGGTRVWSGTNATAQLRAITGVATDVIKGDNAHFWPYGLNYASEVKSEADVIDHCLVVVALRQDMGNP